MVNKRKEAEKQENRQLMMGQLEAFQSTTRLLGMEKGRAGLQIIPTVRRVRQIYGSDSRLDYHMDDLQYDLTSFVGINPTRGEIREALEALEEITIAYQKGVSPLAAYTVGLDKARILAETYQYIWDIWIPSGETAKTQALSLHLSLANYLRSRLFDGAASHCHDIPAIALESILNLFSSEGQVLLQSFPKNETRSVYARLTKESSDIVQEEELSDLYNVITGDGTGLYDANNNPLQLDQEDKFDQVFHLLADGVSLQRLMIFIDGLPKPQKRLLLKKMGYYLAEINTGIYIRHWLRFGPRRYNSNLADILHRFKMENFDNHNDLAQPPIEIKQMTEAISNKQNQDMRGDSFLPRKSLIGHPALNDPSFRAKLKNDERQILDLALLWKDRWFSLTYEQIAAETGFGISKIKITMARIHRLVNADNKRYVPAEGRAISRNQKKLIELRPYLTKQRISQLTPQQLKLFNYLTTPDEDGHYFTFKDAKRTFGPLDQHALGVLGKTLLLDFTSELFNFLQSIVDTNLSFFSPKQRKIINYTYSLLVKGKSLRSSKRLSIGYVKLAKNIGVSPSYLQVFLKETLPAAVAELSARNMIQMKKGPEEFPRKGVIYRRKKDSSPFAM